MTQSTVVRHQLLLMRLVKTQARITGKYLKKAEALVTDAIQSGKFKYLYVKLIDLFGDMPKDAFEIIKDLAIYEAEWSARHLNEDRQITVTIPEDIVLKMVPKIKVSTGLDTEPKTIEKVYKDFGKAKARQYTQIVRDAEVLDQDEEATIAIVKDRTNGLFSTQNLAIAGLAILGTANSIRAEVADANNMLVDWVLDLELNNCPYCEEQANGGPYTLDEVEGEIPAHANCGCTLVPVNG